MPAPKRSTSTSKTANSAKPAAKRTAAAGQRAGRRRQERRQGDRDQHPQGRRADDDAGQIRRDQDAHSASRRAPRARSASTRAGSAETGRQGRGRRCRRDGEDRTLGAKGTATAARAGAKQVRSTALARRTKTRRASGGPGHSVAEQLARAWPSRVTW